MPDLVDDTDGEKKTGEKEVDEIKKVKSSFVQNKSIPDDISHNIQHNEPLEGFLDKKPTPVNIHSDEEDQSEEVERQKWMDERRLNYTINSYRNLPEYKLKADIPSFYGGLQIEGFLDWFYEVESFFKFMDFPESSRVKLASYKLKGGAAAWWETLCEDRDKYHKPPILPWTRMRRLLRDKFLPKDYKKQLFIKLQNCRQGAKLVEEYVAEFYGLVARNQLKETEEQLVVRFIYGLNNLIQQGMTQSSFTMVEAIQQALKVERRVLSSTVIVDPYSKKSTVLVDPHDRSINQPYQQQQTSGSSDIAPLMNIPSTKPSQTAPQRDVVRNIRGNQFQQQFPLLPKSTNPYSKFRWDKCNKCNQTGHTSSECRKFHAYINETQEETLEEEALGDDELLYIQEHETYDANFLGVIRPVFITEPCPTQRHSIFRSHRLIEEKLCNMIIDSGSTENYVSAKLVEKLGLPVTLHPKPHSVGWINISSTQQITHQCLVKFSFPGYSDYALCDIINMTAASLLLGRPWQYDIHVVHNCYGNTYTFVHEVFTKVLYPLQSSYSLKESADKKTTSLVAIIVHSLNTHSLSSHEVTKPVRA
ncbi:uncharacterized protein LOC113312676 [Papaver somniferum]|uniref:uncharacterized protein LOC113312676 n=1 Tax=Papaver somniferum TaxID=3469 RepID=UPI000E6F9898|nr:uncharacterized protein LOC113312676 [Papaver somniferum]